MKLKMFVTLTVLLTLTAALPVHAGEKKVDLNQAGLSELISLPGIGPALAERIIEYREKNGRFRKVEELLNVRGIGEKKFEELEPRVTVAPPPAQEAPKKGKP